MSNINEALLLLVVGMTTVFIILLFIIYMSRLLIVAVNKFVPLSVAAVAVRADKRPTPLGTTVTTPQVVAITTAINLASGGRASILKIEKK